MNAPDIARFGYGSGYTGVGAVPTPLVTGISSFSVPSAPSVGASNPVGAYLQSTPNSGAGASWADFNAGYAGTGYYPPAPGSNNGNSTGFGFNAPTANLVLGGLQTIGSLWQAWQANKLAKEQFKFQKDITETNLANQIQSYNTALEDRTRVRAFTEGMNPSDAQAYLDANRLKRGA